MVEELVNQMLKEGALKQVTSILEASEAFIRVRTRVVFEMRQLAKEMDKHQLNGNIAKVVGSATGVGGGIFAGSLLFAVPTGGLSVLIGAGVAGGFALAGTATQVGTRLTLYGLSKHIEKKVDKLISEDQEAYNELVEKWNKLDRICTKIAKISSGEQPWLTVENVKMVAFCAIKKFIEWVVLPVLNLPVSKAIGALSGGKIGSILTAVFKPEFMYKVLVQPFKEQSFKLFFENLGQYVFDSTIGVKLKEVMWTNVVKNIPGMLSGWVRGSAMLGTVGSMALHAFIIAPAILLVGINFASLLDTIQNMVKGSPSETAIAIRSKVQEMENQRDELQKFVKAVRAAN